GGLLAGLLFSLFQFQAFAQNDLLGMLEDEQGPTTDYAFATFKGTKVVNLQSPELPGKGVLQYTILHRFGSFNDDYFYNFLGLDNAQVRLTLDYSIMDWLNVGVGHSAVNKVYEGFAKYRLMRQSKGARNFPFPITGFSGLYYSALRFPEDARYNESDRLNYVHELVVARKFNQDFSAEIVPTVTHFNLVDSADFSNDVFSIGLAARYKFTAMHALNIEYVYQLNPNSFVNPEDGKLKSYPNALSIGVDIETGGHVFQLFLTNSRGVSEPYVFAQTPGSWLDGDIHFGFNISRVFTIKKPKLPEAEG
ncbi:MAG TPA: hypothetical protein DCG19_04380, partial [Cryomorphaceae bacterium]|nr:hypothetical protein [Cryomorphaceae bacterium]